MKRFPNIHWILISFAALATYAICFYRGCERDEACAACCECKCADNCCGEMCTWTATPTTTPLTVQMSPVVKQSLTPYGALVTRYSVVSDKTPEALETKVNKQLKLGATLVGGVSEVTYPNGARNLTQAITKVVDVPEPAPTPEPTP